MSTAKVTSNISFVTISEISKLRSIWLPEVSIHGIPWKIHVRKLQEEGKHQQSLAAYLHCDKKEPSWTQAAVSSFELLSFDDDQQSVKRHSIPYVFDTSMLGYGIHDLIEWNELFNEDKKYVIDDSIKMKIEIKVEDPNRPNKSQLKFERIDGRCDCGYVANYRLTVENALNLLAVRTPQFNLRGMLLDLTVYKDHTSHIGIFLHCKSENLTCEMTMTATLVSSKENVIQTEKVPAKQMKYLEMFELKDIVSSSWNELFNPENGYVNNGSIIFEVKIKSGKPEGKIPNATINGAMSKLECSICLSNVINKEVSCTPCGHSFCSACIEKAVKDNGRCPLCNEVVQPDDLRRIFLPIAN